MRTITLPSSRGYSIIGLLITMACIVVLFALMMTALNKAVTGEGSAVEGTVRSVVDQEYLRVMGMSMITYAGDNRAGRFITPSEVSGSKDPAENTTANLFSAMVIGNYTTCRQLIAKNEFSGWVREKDNYDFTAHNPARKIFWDKTFVADLADLSNTSFAHQPLFGARFEDNWHNSLDSRWPLIGNRGPKDGVHNPQSLSYGRNGVWGGHVLFADSHVEYISTFTPGNITFTVRGETYQDNLFKMDDAPNGADSVLAFTKAMMRNGPTLQWD